MKKKDRLQQKRINMDLREKIKVVRRMQNHFGKNSAAKLAERIVRKNIDFDKLYQEINSTKNSLPEPS